MKVKYVVHGEPFSVNKLHPNKRRVWDRHEQALFVRKQELVNQHEEYGDPFGGSLLLDVVFYFMTPCSRPYLDGKEHTGYPPIPNLVNFIERLGSDILFNKDTVITEMHAKKLYDYEPRTEIVIVRELNATKKHPIYKESP